jgi:hypothetical protein
VNGAPVRFATSHGRIDQVDHAFVPITSSIASLHTAVLKHLNGCRGPPGAI